MTRRVLQQETRRSAARGAAGEHRGYHLFGPLDLSNHLDIRLQPEQCRQGASPGVLVGLCFTAGHCASFRFPHPPLPHDIAHYREFIVTTKWPAPRTVMQLLVLAVAISVAAPASGFAQVTAIRAGRLIDPETGRVTTGQTILVENGKITAVGSGLTLPPGAEVIDLSAMTVLPGLFDVHTHLCMTVKPRRDADNYYYTTLRDPDATRAIEGVVNARTMLEAGFTTVRDVGNEGNFACTSLRRAIASGMVPGPTMQNAGRIIAPYGGQFHLQPDKPELAEPEYLFADTRDEMLRGVRLNIHYGATVIKIVVDDQRYIYTEEDIRFMIEEARRAGLRLAAHAWTRAGAHNAAAAGVASIEHGFDMTDEDLALAKRNNVVLVGTEFPAAFDSSGHAQWVDRLRRAHRIGVTLAFGTDATTAVPGLTRGSMAITWIDSWREAGIPAQVLLQAMTINAARLMGLEATRGAIRPGLAADIIATRGDPLQDVDALRSVVFVMKDGRVIKAP
jgi:imidazolonepropionase-like amidohydrolase